MTAETSPEAASGSPKVVEQRGLYYEEFDVNTVYRHRPGRTVTETDNVLFTTMTMNTQSLHLDAAWSATQPFGQRLVNSMFTLATLVGSSVSQLTQGTIVANLGFTDVRFPHPLFHGDTMYSESVVDAKRLSSSRPGQGIITLTHTARNQDDVVVATAVRSVLVWCRDAHVTAQQKQPPEATVQSGVSQTPAEAAAGHTAEDASGDPAAGTAGERA